MNLMAKAAFVCLLAFIACDAKKFSPGGSGHYEGLSRRQDTPSCDPCVLPEVPQLLDVPELLIGFASTIQRAKFDFKKIFGNTFNTTEELRAAIDQNLGDVEQETDEIFGKLFNSIENTDSCPPLGILILGFKVHLDHFLEGLTRNWDTIPIDVDRETRLASLAQAMAPDIPEFLLLIRDLLFYWVDAIINKECVNLAPIIFTVFDPYGDLSKALSNRLSSSGSAATDIVKNMLGSFLPDGGAGALDIFYIFAQLLCGILYIVQPGKDFSNLINFFCPAVPEGFDYGNVIGGIVCGIIGLVKEDLPPEIVSICIFD